ncbi:MAG: DJ-1/PfpI family protein [Oscillospiraceae bacterium]|nr:DJ-1/PfpI family protein [Oscillospiraceae bacterium]
MILCFLADGFEEVEALTPIDCLRRCKKEVKTIGIGGKTQIHGSHAITVKADIADIDYYLSDDIEMIILPGGKTGTDNLEKSILVSQAIDICMTKKLPIAAICAAPSILGHKGLLKGKKAVCYTGFEKELIGAEVLDTAVAVDGNIITACGMGAALEFSYAIVSKLISKDKADELMDSLNVRQRNIDVQI